MHCFLCGKKIGFFRSLADQQYCCTSHRKEAGLASAQALRDEEDAETWAARPNRKKALAKKQGTSAAGQAGAVLAFVVIGGAMIAVLLMGGTGKPGGGGAFASDSAETGN